MIFETKQVVIALERERSCKMSNVLLKLEENIEKREEGLFFFLYFLLVKETSSTSSISTEHPLRGCFFIKNAQEVKRAS